MSFLLKTEPYAHQFQALQDSANAEYWALLMSMRTGKSKVILDTATHLYSQGKIGAVVVLAPKGVHRNWVDKELPTHLPDEVPCIAAYWQGLDTKKDRQTWERLYTSDSIPLRVFTFNFDAIIHPKGKAELKRALTTFRCLFVVDESHRCKTPTAKRTEVATKAARLAPYRRILTGTFLTGTPLDTFAQLRLLDPTLPGYSTFTAFKAHYALTETKLKASGRIKVGNLLKRQGVDPGMVDLNAFANPQTLRQAGCRPGADYFEDVTGYQRLAELHALVARYATIVRAEDCVDLPEKVYERLDCDLTTEQRRLYTELLEQSVAELRGSSTAVQDMTDEELLMYYLDGADKIKAENALTKLLRLQQVVGGFATTDTGEVIPLKSERLSVLLDTLDDIDGKVLIWARFRPELAAIYAALQDKYGQDTTVRYYGGVGDEERAEAVRRLDEDDACRFFVGNPQSGGIGLPLHAADTMIYYSRDYTLETALQSEERASKVGKTNSILILDLVATDTTDDKVLGALQAKRLQAGEFYDAVVEVQSDDQIHLPV